MKIIIKTFILILCFFSIKANAQLDTLNYLKQFEASKVNYIGQPFSKLLNDMQILHPKTVWTIISHKKKDLIRNTTFNFCEMDDTFNDDTVNLTIEWQTPLPSSETEYYENKNGFYFTNDEKNYYGSKIVKDIHVYK